LTLPLVIEEGAEAEIESAVWWYERRRPGLGDRFLAEFDEATARIAENSLTAGLAPHLPAGLGVRRVLMDRFPYL
jgi:toxin ParE1/3/4